MLQRWIEYVRPRKINGLFLVLSCIHFATKSQKNKEKSNILCFLFYLSYIYCVPCFFGGGSFVIFSRTRVWFPKILDQKQTIFFTRPNVRYLSFDWKGTHSKDMNNPFTYLSYIKPGWHYWQRSKIHSNRIPHSYSLFRWCKSLLMSWDIMMHQVNHIPVASVWDSLSSLW